MGKSDDVYAEDDSDTIDPGHMTADQPQEGSQDEEVEATENAE
jgi:hypothetical protein